MDAAHDAGQAVLVHLHVGAVAAGVHRHHAVAQAVLLVCLAVAQNHEGVVVVAGGAAGGGHGLDGVQQGHPLGLPLHGVAAVEVDHIPPAEGQVQTHGRGLFQPQGLIAAVHQPDGPGDDVLLSEHAVQQLQRKAGHAVLHADAQGLGLVFLVVGAGQAGQGVFALLDAVARVAPLGTGSAGFIPHHQAGQTEIAGVAAGVFLGQGVRRDAPACPVGVVVGREAPVRRGIHGRQVALADGRAVVEMEQAVQMVQPHLVGGAAGGKGKGARGGVKLNAHTRVLLEVWNRTGPLGSGAGIGKGG